MGRPKNSEFDPMTLVLAGSEDEGQEAIETRILSEFNQAPKTDDWNVTIARFVKYGQPEERCFEADVDDLKGIPDRLANEWGPGQYIVRVRQNGTIKHAFRYAIGAPKVSPAQSVKTEIGSFVQLFQESMREQRAMFEKFLERASRPSSSEKSSTVTELVAALGALDQLRGRDAAPAANETPVEKVIELVKLGMDLADRGGGSGSAKKGWADIVLELVNSPLVQKIGELSTQALPATSPANAKPVATLAAPKASAPAANEGVSPSETTQAPDVDQAKQVQQFLFHQIAYLLGRAAQWKVSGMQKSHPDLYAEWTIDNFPIELLLPLAQAPDLIGQLQAIVPEVGPHADWFMALFDAVRAELTEEGLMTDSAPLANGANGSAPHVSESPAANAGVDTGGAERGS